MADFAKRTGTRAGLLSREITRMAHAAKKLAPDLAQAEVYVGEERDLVRRVSDFVCAQADRLLALAPQVTKVNVKLL